MVESTDTPKRANEVDKALGAQLRMWRNLRSLTQEQMAHALGVSFQQIQKYERGKNRIGASRLFEISELLGVPIATFFDNIPACRQFIQDRDSKERIPGLDADAIRLLRHFDRIEGAGKRRALVELAELLSTE